MNTFKGGWFVIYTKPHHEKKVTEQLSKVEVESFLPTIKTLRTWWDRKKYVDLPLFPSYVFVNLKNVQSYFTSLHIEGILCYVKLGKEIARVSESVIDNIKLIIEHPKELEISYEYFQPGNILLVKEGPFTGFHCEIVEFKGKQKILVRIDLLNRSILLNIPVEHLSRYVSKCQN